VLSVIKNAAEGFAAPFHGGRLRAASEQYGIPLGQWQDLSTGVSPWAYPVPVIPKDSWHQLPDDSELKAVAASFYGFDGACCPVAGSQIAIREIPKLLAPSTVAIPTIGYQEHEYAWRSAGHSVVYYDSWQGLLELVRQGLANHVVVINPNNPTAEFAEVEQLLALKQSMPADGLMLVDEAFVEGAERPSLLSKQVLDGIVVLRSIGKFFGIAGLRLGFAFGDEQLIQRLQGQVQPWGVSGPAIDVGIAALKDTDWHREQEQRIREASAELQALVKHHWPDAKTASAGLFTTVFAPAELIERRFTQSAEQAVLLRKGRVDDKTAWLRIGLADDYSRLNQSWLA